MKIIKNRIVQILAVLILLVGVALTVNYFTKPVMASDELTKGEFNTKMEDINKKFEEMNNKITLLETNLENLQAENTNLKSNLEESNKKIKILEDSKDLTKLTDRVKNIEIREDYFYNELAKSELRETVFTKRVSEHILKNLK